MLTTPNKGIRYPVMSEAGDPQAIMAMTFDLDTMATADDALRTTALSQRASQITNSTLPSIVKNTNTKFTYDTVVQDPNGLVNLGVNNDRFTITVPGLYMFGIAFVYDQAGFGGLVAFSGEVTLAKNIVTAPAAPNYRRRKFRSFATGSGGTLQCWCAAPFVMAAADFMTSQTFWNGSGAGPGLGASAPVFWCAPIALT